MPSSVTSEQSERSATLATSPISGEKQSRFNTPSSITSERLVRTPSLSADRRSIRSVSLEPSQLEAMMKANNMHSAFSTPTRPQSSAGMSSTTSMSGDMRSRSGSPDLYWGTDGDGLHVSKTRSGRSNSKRLVKPRYGSNYTSPYSQAELAKIVMTPAGPIPKELYEPPHLTRDKDGSPSPYSGSRPYPRSRPLSFHGFDHIIKSKENPITPPHTAMSSSSSASRFSSPSMAATSNVSTAPSTPASSINREKGKDNTNVTPPNQAIRPTMISSGTNTSLINVTPRTYSPDSRIPSPSPLNPSPTPHGKEPKRLLSKRIKRLFTRRSDEGSNFKSNLHATASAEALDSHSAELVLPSSSSTDSRDLELRSKHSVESLNGMTSSPQRTRLIAREERSPMYQRGSREDLSRAISYPAVNLSDLYSDDDDVTSPMTAGTLIGQGINAALAESSKNGPSESAQNTITAKALEPSLLRSLRGESRPKGYGALGGGSASGGTVRRKVSAAADQRIGRSSMGTIVVRARSNSLPNLGSVLVESNKEDGASKKGMEEAKRALVELKSPPRSPTKQFSPLVEHSLSRKPSIVKAEIAKWEEKRTEESGKRKSFETVSSGWTTDGEDEKKDSEKEVDKGAITIAPGVVAVGGEEEKNEESGVADEEEIAKGADDTSTEEKDEKPQTSLPAITIPDVSPPATPGKNEIFSPIQILAPMYTELSPIPASPVSETHEDQMTDSYLGDSTIFGGRKVAGSILLDSMASSSIYERPSSPMSVSQIETIISEEPSSPLPEKVEDEKKVTEGETQTDFNTPPPTPPPVVTEEHASQTSQPSSMRGMNQLTPELRQELLEWLSTNLDSEREIRQRRGRAATDADEREHIVVSPRSFDVTETEMHDMEAVNKEKIPATEGPAPIESSTSEKSTAETATSTTVIQQPVPITVIHQYPKQQSHWGKVFAILILVLLILLAKVYVMMVESHVRCGYINETKCACLPPDMFGEDMCACVFWPSWCV